MKKHPETTIRCFARAGLHRVSVITPGEIAWRSYELFAFTPEEAMRRALRSVGITAAWAQAALPVAKAPQATADEAPQGEEQEAAPKVDHELES